MILTQRKILPREGHFFNNDEMHDVLFYDGGSKVQMTPPLLH
jgi:hypothetical protein